MVGDWDRRRRWRGIDWSISKRIKRGRALWLRWRSRSRSRGWRDGANAEALRDQVLALELILIERASVASGARGELFASNSRIGPETTATSSWLVYRWSTRASDGCRVLRRRLWRWR